MLADLGRDVGERVFLMLHVAAENQVHVDAGPWRYPVGIDESAGEPVATVLEREQRQW